MSKNVKSLTYKSKDGAYIDVQIRLAGSGMSNRDCRYVSLKAGRPDNIDMDPVLVHVCIDCGTVYTADGSKFLSTRKDDKKPRWNVTKESDLDVKKRRKK